MSAVPRALTDPRDGRYPSRVRNNSGKANPIGILFLVAIATVIYLGVIFLPAWSDNIDVQDAINIAVAQSNRDDDYLRRLIQDKLRYIGTHKEDDGYGNLTVEQGLGFTVDDIQIDRNDVNNTIQIAISYTRELQLKPTQKIWTVHFHPSQTGPIKP